MSVKSENLMKFLRLLYRKNERVYFFPLMIGAKLKEYTDTKKPYPLTIGKLSISKYRNPDKWCPPATALNPLSASVDSSTFNKTFDRLTQLNELGYDIYLTPNPLTYKRRIEETVKEIRYIVVESDDMPDDISIPAQQAFLNMIKPNVRVAVFTGNRSIHIYIPLIKIIPNPECLYANQYRMIKYLPDDNPDIIIPEYDDVVKCFKSFLSSHGYLYDPRVLKSICGLTRCPFFINHKSGNMADVVYSSNESHIGYLDDLGVDGLVIDEGGRLEWESFKGLNGVSCISTVTPVETMISSSSNNTPANEPTIEVPATTIPDNQDEGLFIRNLNTYEELKISGIPSRHTRRLLHKPMFTVARLFDWNDNKLAQEWRHIVSINPRNIGIDVDGAVDDLLREWELEKEKPFKFWSPAQTTLPDASKTNINHVKIKLSAWGCRKAQSATNIIIKTLYPTIRKALPACLRGTVAIRAKDMLKACNGYAYKETMRWLDEMNILRLKDNSYTPGNRSRLWFVNVHLVIFLMGFKELNWKQEQKGKVNSRGKQKTPTDDWLEDVATDATDFEFK